MSIYILIVIACALILNIIGMFDEQQRSSKIAMLWLFLVALAFILQVVQIWGQG